MKYLVLITVISCLSSCSKEDKKTKYQVTRETLNLNFDENILNTSPYRAQTTSEQFVRDLMFETLCEKDSSSNIFSNITISADQQTYTFTIDTTKRFNNNSKVNSQAIQHFFTELINVSHENIKQVFSQIRGYKNSITQLPEGISFTDDSHMTIQLKKPFDIINVFSKEPFYINSNGIGTGPYINVIADDDILFTLDRVDKIKRGVNYIRIRFIKNQKEMLNEFMNGNLDILESKYVRTDSTKMTNETLNTIISDKYDGFNVSYLKSGYIIYSSIYDMYDSLRLSQLSHEQALDSLWLSNNIQQTINNTFTSLNGSSTTSSSDTTQIIITKKYHYTTSTDYNDFIPELVAKSSDQKLPKAICVFSIAPDKYFYTNAISELANYQSLSEQIIKIRFKPVVQF